AYGAELGAGAFVIEQGSGRRRLQVSTNDDLRYSLLVTGFPYDVQENPGKAVDYFGAFLKNSRAVRRLGSAAIDLCYVADGVFDGFWEVSLNPWDICAGKLLVEEAGGSVTDFNGIRQDIFCKQLLATNGKVHKSMMEILV
ncbi:MAG: inositol monophosphatase family protein, partial [Syntrophothermus sp.]